MLSQGSARCGSLGLDGRVNVWMGSVGHGRAGMVRTVKERYGRARLGVAGMARRGQVRFGLVWQDGLVEVRLGLAWLGRFGNHYKTKRSWIWYLI